MPSAEPLKFEYTAAEPIRLDKYLAESLQAYSRAQVQGWISEGLVSVNGQVKTKDSFRLGLNDKVEIRLPVVFEEGICKEEIPLEILYEDDSVLVVNKAAGMVVHPGAGNSTGTLVNAAIAHAAEIGSVGEAGRPGVVHRLDKDTSGVMILAKTEEAYRHLVKQFKNRKAEKTYICLVDGTPPTPVGRIEANIHRDERFRQKMAVTYEGKGRRAISEYRTLETLPSHTLLEVMPLTGRTHQIRVHLAYIGVPVAGDKVYGRRKPTIPGGRFFLHAQKLKIRLPDGKERTFTAELPDDLQSILNQLEGEK